MSTTHLSDELRHAIEKAFEVAREARHEAVTPEHLLLALLDDPTAAKIFEAVDADASQMREELQDYLQENIPRVPEDRPYERPVATPSFQKLLQQALFQVRAAGGRSDASINEIVVAFFNDKTLHAVNILDNQGVSRLDVANFISHKIRKGEDQPAMSAGVEEDDDKQSNALAQFTHNLNTRASAGKIDPLIGREAEVERVVQILSRRRKNNPILVGDPGVGKTAIAEGLAKRIVEGDVPDTLKGCEILSLDLAALVAGTKYRGDFESRIKAVVKQLSGNSKQILFIDEIHTLIGAGASSGGNMDAANLLKPSLSNGDLRCIGATTYAEHRKIFEADHSLSRRFQKVDIMEPSIEDSIRILTGLVETYEAHHGLKYTPDAVEAAVKLSARHIPDRMLPDKAIDIIDEAGALQRTAPAGQAVSVITAREIEAVVARVTGVPVGLVSANDTSMIQELGPKLDSRVFEQKIATAAVSEAVELNRSGLGQPNKPLGSFLFTGPTGVGKTETAKALADELGLKLLRFDMSEYMEKHAISRLIGAPPGYVGHDEGGQLIEQVNKHKRCVVLLDEIEKAHPDVFNALLQVFDNAMLTDGKGRKADFSNALIIMTTNAGAALAAGKRSIGFSANPENASQEMVDNALKSTFSPEFRNRLDAIIPFQALSPAGILQVVDKELARLDQELRAREHVVSITFTDAVRQHLAKEGFDPAMGARPLNRLIVNTIRKPLAKELLYGQLKTGGEVEIDVEADASSPKAGALKVVHRVGPPSAAVVAEPVKKPARARARR
jgi:ATP-dependent Clp protease ATP-binding subunit ClpA